MKPCVVFSVDHIFIKFTYFALYSFDTGLIVDFYVLLKKKPVMTGNGNSTKKFLFGNF